MGKLGQGLLGPTSGKVGPVVGAKWKSLTTVRARPRKSASPATVLQQDQQNKLSLLSTFFSALLELLPVSFRPLKINLSAHNAAVSFNLKRSVFVDTKPIGLDYSKIVVSRGSLFSASGVQVMISDEGILRLSWNDDSGDWCDSVYESREMDTLTVVFNYRNNKNMELFHYSQQLATRAELSAVSQLPKQILQADLIHCWIYFTSSDGKMASQSQYYSIVI